MLMLSSCAAPEATQSPMRAETMVTINSLSQDKIPTATTREVESNHIINVNRGDPFKSTLNQVINEACYRALHFAAVIKQLWPNHT